MSDKTPATAPKAEEKKTEQGSIVGVWLQSKKNVFALRNGIGHDAPMLAVFPDRAQFFSKLSAEQFADDSDVKVVANMAPPKDGYEPITKREFDERRKAGREEAADERRARKRKEKENRPLPTNPSKVAKRAKAERVAANKRRLEAEAEAGEREVI